MAGQLLRVNISPALCSGARYDVLTDTAFIVFAIWSGWYVMGAVYALQAAIKAQMYAELERKLTAQAVPE
ncbi:Uncharacterised protein [Klebsiella pneumoniae]|uniref:Uncharacterized protein n=1 Tax=Klebsiella pneumoniae TaxID=573 RepID=A0A2X3IML5_KLEPN|nr:Uncharacterised protein [Klebsiella pneumoniae]